MENKTENTGVKWRKVESSNLDAIFYDSGKQTLDVRFKNGNHYQYFEVPEETYKAFLAAESAGKFFHSAVRAAFKYAKIEKEQPLAGAVSLKAPTGQP